MPKPKRKPPSPDLSPSPPLDALIAATFAPSTAGLAGLARRCAAPAPRTPRDARTHLAEAAAAWAACNMLFARVARERLVPVLAEAGGREGGAWCADVGAKLRAVCGDVEAIVERGAREVFGVEGAEVVDAARRLVGGGAEDAGEEARGAKRRRVGDGREEQIDAGAEWGGEDRDWGAAGVVFADVTAEVARRICEREERNAADRRARLVPRLRKRKYRSGDSLASMREQAADLSIGEECPGADNRGGTNGVKQPDRKKHKAADDSMGSGEANSAQHPRTHTSADPDPEQDCVGPRQQWQHGRARQADDDKKRTRLANEDRREQSHDDRTETKARKKRRL